MQCITYDIERVDSASFTAERIGEGASLSAILAGRVSFTAERICSFFPGAALDVTPDFVWLNEGNDFTAHFEVVSNVEWKIE